ncbi:MAG: hypothetical protein ABI835_05060 [Chloroflexota bacterium]
MKVDIRWENEAKTVIRYSYSGEWSWDDFYAILNQRDPPPPDGQLSALVDLRQTTHLPGDAVLHLKSAAKMAEEIDGMVVIITSNTAMTTLFNIFVTIYKRVGKRFRVVNSEEEAYAILKILPKNDLS